MTKKRQGNPDSDAYQRILRTAEKLFYHQGYRATGINEIIEKSGVAKATFYAHFPSKEALALAYVTSMNTKEADEFTQGIAKYKGPYEKLLGFFKYGVVWSEKRNHRGCTYLIMSSELTDHESPIRKVGELHYNTFWDNVHALVKALKVERGAAWKDVNTEHITDEFFLIFTGALALAQVYHSKDPFVDALEPVKRLLE